MEKFSDDELFVEDWSALREGLTMEVMPDARNAGGSTVATVGTASTISCPAGCVYSWGTASSGSG
ncbi:hypothetical protein ACZ90_67155 [Streptomyces albus subsp. albus]|nr:hypothetical protein ACZ90_67155 [Streptomyces albus subsp. albus]